MLISVGVLLLAVSAVGYALAKATTRRAVSRTEIKVTAATPVAQMRLAQGASPDDVAGMLLDEWRLPPLAGVWVLSDAAKIKPKEALRVVYPRLSQRQQDLIDRMPTARPDSGMRAFD